MVFPLTISLFSLKATATQRSLALMSMITFLPETL